MRRTLSADMSMQGVGTGLLIALVGYASSVAIVIQGLQAVGASTANISSALVFLALGKGIVAVSLSLATRMPISIAWSTPGLALLATVGPVAGGFPAVVGAFIVTGALIALAGLWPRLSALIAAIPKSIANAMLAGVLLKLCLAPFVAIGELPLVAGLVVATWTVLQRIWRRTAVPAAVIVAVAATLRQMDGHALEGLSLLPQIVPVMPMFTVEALVSIALPLFIVTMASQNITGLAVLGAFGYRPRGSSAFLATGLMSALIAPFGGPTINLAAVTAVLAAGPDAHPDPARRYVAALFAGIGYMLFGLLAGIAAAFVTRSQPILIEAVAGLALVGAFIGAIRGAVEDDSHRLPAAMTFLVTASGMSLAGVGSAFWGLLFGIALIGLDRTGRPAPTPAPAQTENGIPT